MIFETVKSDKRADEIPGSSGGEGALVAMFVSLLLVSVKIVALIRI